MRRTVAILVVFLSASCTGIADDHPRGPSPGVVGEAGFAALWPEQTLDAATVTQRASDAGDPQIAWRTDPVGTARAFAAGVLGWDAARVTESETWELRSGIQIARVWLCDANGCPAAGAAFDEEVILKRLTGRGDLGVWSVTDVTSGRLLLEQSAGIRIRDPRVLEGKRLDALAFEGGLPDGTRVVAGSTTLGPCGPVAETTMTTVQLSRVRFQVAAHLALGCGRTARPEATPGYVFVYPQRRGMAADPARLFTLARPAGSAPILDLTAMAVRFIPRDEVPGPLSSWRSRDPSRLPACGPEQLEAAIGAGRAVPDLGVGIFVAVRKTSGPACRVDLDLRLSLREPTGGRIGVPGEHVQPLVGYLPGYVPGARTLLVGWGLFEWCGYGDSITAIVRAPGLEVDQASWSLAQWCIQRHGDPRLEVVELDPAA